jgi:hypothetical protein
MNTNKYSWLLGTLSFGIILLTGIRAQAFSERRWYPANEANFFEYIVKGPGVSLNLGKQNQIF